MAPPKPKKLFSREAHRKCLKCSVCVDIKSVVCPGALLPLAHNVYLSVCLLGQYRKTPFLPPVFPLLFHHKMFFSKTFPGVVDPADVADLLEADTTSFELIQLVPPEGEILATMEDSTRDFLYPGPVVSSAPGAPEREILMKRSSSLSGISPIVDFTATSVIEEIDGTDGRPVSPSPASPARLSRSPPSSPPPKPHSLPLSLHSPGAEGGSFAPSDTGKEDGHDDGDVTDAASASSHRRSRSASGHRPHRNERKKQRSASDAAANAGYQQPTAASIARSLSPYTHRRMCQLSEDARQRLQHLQLGPHHFRKETDRQPPFLLSSISSPSVLGSPSSDQLSSSHTGTLHRHSISFMPDHNGSDLSLLGSYRPSKAKLLPILRGRRSSLETPPKHEGQIRTLPRPPGQAQLPPAAPDSHSPLILSRLSLRERFHSLQPIPSYGEQIHKRVQRILETHTPKPPTDL